jgi:hypothetical protein
MAAVIDDLKNLKPSNQLPTFHAIVRHLSYHGSPVALSMNKRIFDLIAEYERETKKDFSFFKIDKYKEILFVTDQTLLSEFRKFLDGNGYQSDENINVAGKNFATFDRDFLSTLNDWKEFKIARRVLDPAILYVEPQDKYLPNTKDCKVRSGLFVGKEEYTHNAVIDAQEVIELIRHKLLPNYNEILK